MRFFRAKDEHFLFIKRAFPTHFEHRGGVGSGSFGEHLMTNNPWRPEHLISIPRVISSQSALFGRSFGELFRRTT